MDKKCGFALVCLTLVLVLAACANDSSNAGEAGEAVSDAQAVGDANTPSAEAYAQLQTELLEIQKTATNQTKMMEAVNLASEKLQAFIAEYPGTDEAEDAKLQLGMMFTSVSQFDKAVPFLEDYIKNGDKEDERVGYAHFYAAESYKNIDKLDQAKTHFKAFVEEYAYVNPKFLAAAQSSLEDLEVLKTLTVGKEPIPFSVEGLDGKTISLADYRGKVLLIDFWATWCMPCKVEMPNVIRVHKKFNEKGFEIIGISLDNNREAVEQYIKDNNMTWPQFFDGKGWQNTVAQQYRVRSIPATYLIDKNGKIRYRSLRGEDLETAVEKLLNET
jgi:peroxiredoxin